MAVIESGSGAAQANVGAANATPLHVVAKPQPYDVGGSPVYGHYQIAVATGDVGAGAGADSEVLQFRWTDVTRMALIQRVWLTGMRATTAFAAGVIDLKLTRATAWTVAGTGGGTVTLTDPEAELRSSQMGASLAAEIRVATTAALGAGTKTLDTGNFGQIVTHSSGGVGSATPIIGSIYLPTLELFTVDVGAGEHPLVLEDDEGFVVRATVPGTGVWNLGIGVKWAEVAYF